MTKRNRGQCLFSGLVRRALPGNVIGQIAGSATSTGPTRAGKADSPEPLHQYARFSSLVVNVDVAFKNVIAKVPHPGANASESPGRCKEEDAAETDRQLHPRLAIFDRRGAGREYLERSIEEHRMQGILV